MEVNDELVDKLAGLAMLTFNAQEKEAIKNDLQKMLEFIKKLEEVNTDGVKPLLHMTQSVNVLRDDIITGTCTSEEALSNAPLKDSRFFKVPTVIKK